MTLLQRVTLPPPTTDGSLGFWLRQVADVLNTIPEGLVDVQDKGARGDGVTDDTDAIQAAIDATDAGMIYLPAGTYPISDTLVGKNHTWLGAGMTKTIIRNDNTAGAAAVSFTDKQGVALRDLTVKGNASSGHGLVLERDSTNCWNFVIDHCSFHSHGGDGIYADRAFNGKISNCQLGESGGRGNLGNAQIEWENGGTNIIIENCWFRDIQDTKWGIISGSNTNISIVGNNFSGDTASITWNGVLLKNTSQFVIDACNFENDANCTLGAAIQLGDSTPTWWRSGYIGPCSYVEGTGSITNKILVNRLATNDDALVTVVGDQHIISLGAITNGYFHLTPWTAAAISGVDTNKRVLGYATTPQKASGATIVGSGPIVRAELTAGGWTYFQIGIAADGSLVTEAVP